VIIRSTAFITLLFFLWLIAIPDLHAQEVPDRDKPTQDDEVIRVETNLVSIPVSVRDRKGRFITDLRQEDFQIFENGARQGIAHFAPIEQLFSVVLLIDTSGSTQIRLKDIQESAIAFIEQLRPDDRVLPISFGNEVVALLPSFSSDRETLRTAIRQTQTSLKRSSSGETISIRGKTYSVAYAGTRLYDAVHVASELFEPVQARKAIILFTDGFDSASQVATLKSTLQQVEKRDAVIYAVQYCNYCEIKDVMSRRPVIVRANNYLEDLANRTGGRFYHANDMKKIAQAFTSIAEELRRLYSLGYYPTAREPGAAREVTVKVKRNDLVVRERKTYTQKTKPQ
jgi:Ca-activated chloride channel homolog